METDKQCNCPKCRYVREQGWIAFTDRWPARNEPIQWINCTSWAPVTGVYRGGNTFILDGAPGQIAELIPVYWRPRPPEVLAPCTTATTTSIGGSANC